MPHQYVKHWVVYSSASLFLTSRLLITCTLVTPKLTHFRSYYSLSKVVSYPSSYSQTGGIRGNFLVEASVDCLGEEGETGRLDPEPDGGGVGSWPSQAAGVRAGLGPHGLAGPYRGPWGSNYRSRGLAWGPGGQEKERSGGLLIGQ